MNFNINLPVRIVSSKDCVKNNSHLLKAIGTKALIVTSSTGAKKSGALDDITSALDNENIGYLVYDKITENPRLDHCYEASVKAVEAGADFIIGIGGGSPLDAAKAVAVYAANPDITEEEIYTKTDRKKALPIVAIGTTAGTGSEVGRVSVLTHPVTGRKRSIAPDDCYPTLTFADAKYTESMPFGVTVSTALDALAHALEGYMSVKCDDIPTMFGEKGICLIWEGLKYLNETKSLPDSLLREKLYYGSLYAGITLSYCGTAFPHPLGYVLTENYGVPHGMACAAFMTDFVDRALIHTPEKMNRIFEITDATADEFKSTIASLTDVGEIKMTKEQIEKHCERFDTTPANFKFSPGGFTKEEAIDLFVKKYVK